MHKQAKMSLIQKPNVQNRKELAQTGPLGPAPYPASPPHPPSTGGCSHPPLGTKRQVLFQCLTLHVTAAMGRDGGLGPQPLSLSPRGCPHGVGHCRAVKDSPVSVASVRAVSASACRVWVAARQVGVAMVSLVGGQVWGAATKCH